MIEEPHRQRRDVDCPADAVGVDGRIEIEARAFGHDAGGLRRRVTRGIRKQAHEPVGSIAHRLAVDLEDIAELEPAVVAVRHDDDVRAQVARRTGCVQLLRVAFLADRASSGDGKSGRWPRPPVSEHRKLSRINFFATSN